MRFARLSVVLGVAAAMGAAACSFGGESTDASNDEITAGGDVSQVLKSVLVLETGCMAVKSGPKQLILAARCVVGDAACAEGKSVGFTLASGITVLASAPKDAGTDAATKNAGAPRDAPQDHDRIGGRPTPRSSPTARTTRVASTPLPRATRRTSPSSRSPTSSTRSRRSPSTSSYVVTPAWRTTDEHLCATNIGAPLFRGTQAVVAGITSNFTTYSMTTPVPVTVHHTRVDISSKVGPWLQDLGIVTIRSCSNDEGD